MLLKTAFGRKTERASASKGGTKARRTALQEKAHPVTDAGREARRKACTARVFHREGRMTAAALHTAFLSYPPPESPKRWELWINMWIRWRTRTPADVDKQGMTDILHVDKWWKNARKWAVVALKKCRTRYCGGARTHFLQSRGHSRVEKLCTEGVSVHRMFSHNGGRLMIK